MHDQKSESTESRQETGHSGDSSMRTAEHGKGYHRRRRCRLCALSGIILIEYSGIHAKGVKRWAKSFAEPVAVVAPLNVLEIFIRPLSLCMRLFGNVLGAFVVMELLKIIMPAILPIPFSLYFDIFDGLIQAYVFVFLTSLFIKEAIE